jgi:hypothetical protein
MKILMTGILILLIGAAGFLVYKNMADSQIIVDYATAHNYVVDGNPVKHTLSYGPFTSCNSSQDIWSVSTSLGALWMRTDGTTSDVILVDARGHKTIVQ